MGQIVKVVTTFNSRGELLTSWAENDYKVKGILHAYDYLLALQNNLPEHAEIIVSPKQSTRVLMYRLDGMEVGYYYI